MRKLWFLHVFTGLALFACLDNSTTPEEAGPKGSARIKLPVVPETALAKTGFRVAPAYTFSITVSGPGMSTRTQSWDAVEFGGTTVTLEDIPSGADRVFTGRIMSGMTVTHEGSYVVGIGAGESVFVPLVLRDVRSGRAEICMEVEGWPTPKCTPIDTMPVNSNLLSGCWQIDAYEAGTLLSGVLSIFSMEGSLYGTFRATNGLAYFANPVYVNSAWRVTLRPSIPRLPGSGEHITLEDRQVLPVLLKTDAMGVMPQDSLFPPDSGLYRSFQLRLDNIQSGLHAGPLSFLSGVTMDQSYMAVRGNFKGYFTACGEVVIDDPVDTTWVDTAWAHDMREVIR